MPYIHDGKTEVFVPEPETPKNPKRKVWPVGESAPALVLSDDEKKQGALNLLREERNRRLAETDFYFLTDYAGEVPEGMSEYRQELRDLPKDTLNPTEPEWPVKPVFT